MMALNRSINASFRCKFTRVAKDADCHKLSIGEKELSDNLFQAIQFKTREILSLGDSEAYSILTAGKERPLEYKQDTEALRNLYEQSVSGTISPELYREKKAKLDQDAIWNKQIHASQTMRIDQTKAAKEAFEALLHISGLATASGGLTKELVDLLVEKVLVFPGNRIEICWNNEAFDDAARIETEGIKNAG